MRPQLTPYALRLIAQAEFRKEVARLLANAIHKRQGKLCACGQWGAKRVGSGFQCEECRKKKRRSGFAGVHQKIAQLP